jgi:hypothetical protein
MVGHYCWVALEMGGKALWTSEAHGQYLGDTRFFSLYTIYSFENSPMKLRIILRNTK